MKKRLLASLLMALTLLLQMPMVSLAANTVFMVPEISTTWDPPGMIYKSPSLDSLAYETWYGLVADIISNRGLEAALADLNANVSPSAYSNSILGIYPEGDVLSDNIMHTIAGAGWQKIEVYYPTFLLSGNPNCGGMAPVVEKTENEDLSQLLTAAGYTNQVAIIKVEGVTFADPLMILYEPDFSFLRNGECIMYKYIPDIQRFVPGPGAMYDGYDKGFLDTENLIAADGEANGTYVVAQALPTELVITTEEIGPLREQLKEENTPIPDDTQDSDVNGWDDTGIPEEDRETVITDRDEEVKWTFASGSAPENFTPEATIEVTSKKDVKVDFAFSGKLPKGTAVTIRLPKEGNMFEEGTKLFFYYYNPETKGHEFVSEGIALNGEVTFDIGHCSEYLITAEELVSETPGEKEPKYTEVVVAGGIAVCMVAAVVVYLVIKKKK